MDRLSRALGIIALLIASASLVSFITVFQKMQGYESKLEVLHAELDRSVSEVELLRIMLEPMSDLAANQLETLEERQKLSSARAELAEIKLALLMYQVEDNNSAYPSDTIVKSHEDLVRLLSRYGRIPSPSEASWTFIGYLSIDKDDFMLMAEAKDSKKTQLYITP